VAKEQEFCPFEPRFCLKQEVLCQVKVQVQVQVQQVLLCLQRHQGRRCALSVCLARLPVIVSIVPEVPGVPGVPEDLAGVDYQEVKKADFALFPLFSL